MHDHMLAEKYTLPRQAIANIPRIVIESARMWQALDVT